MLVWAQNRFNKNHSGTHYTKFVFLHMVGSVGQVVHCGASGSANIDALFFTFG
jgi:hypothetical protein